MRSLNGIRTVRALGMLLTSAVLSTLFTAPSLAYYQRPSDTTRVSLTSQREQASGNSGRPVITPDGRYVAFESIATDLVPGVDTRGNYQIYVHDRETGEIDIVSVSSEGEASNEWVTASAISADGRYVVFDTNATNLVPQQTASWQVYLHDRVTNTTELISRNAEGVAANRSSKEGTVSEDGRYVAYQSYASNLVPGTTPNRIHIYLLDRSTGEIELISRAPDGSEGDGGTCSVGCHDSKEPEITPDGRFIAYNSHATNLVDEPGGPGLDVFVYDRSTRITDLVSARSDGVPQDQGAWSHSISADGQVVAFHSTARNMTPSNSWDVFHVYVHDRETGKTERVSVSSDGVEGNGGAQEPVVSGNGRFIAFTSYAFNLAPEEELNKRPDVYVYDRLTRATEKITRSTDGGAADSDSGHPAISHDGSLIAYESLARNLVPGDTNGRRDVFVHERESTTGVGRMSVTDAGAELSVEGDAAFSGRIVSSAVAAPSPVDPASEASDTHITAASVTYRVEREDLLFQSDLGAMSEDIFITSSQGQIYAARSPSIVYGWSFDAAGSSWEVRVQRVALTDAPDKMPWEHGAKLFECLGACVPVASLRGGVGTAGVEVRTGLPLDALGIAPGETLENLRAFAVPGELTAGHLAPVGGLALPNAALPRPAVELAIAPAAAPLREVVFETDAALEQGAFSGSLDITSLAGGDYNVWTRACLADACGAASRALAIEGDTIEPTATVLELTVEGVGSKRLLQARLSHQDSPGVPVAGRTIDFYGDGELIGSAITNDVGIATLEAPPRYRGGKHLFEAAFAGDEDYLASTTGEQT